MTLQLTTTWQHIRRSPYQSLVALVVATMTMLIGLVCTYITLSMQRVLTQIDRKPEIIVFFNDSVTLEEQTNSLQTALLETGKVAKMSFVSKDDALKIYQEKNTKDPLLLELVTAKILPASLEIAPKTAADLPKLYEIVQKAPNIEEISYPEKIVENMIVVIREVRRIGLGLIILLVISSVLVVITSIGMKISMRKEEIEVQRLIGASKFYIAWPFLLEGMFYGAMSVFLAWGLGSGVFYIVAPHLLAFLKNIDLLSHLINNTLYIFLSSLGVGIIIGFCGSFIAVNRYLKD